MQLKPQVILTGDGSKSLSVPGLNESYHSIHGALAESKHVFIREGLNFKKKNKVKIFELGFGTGLNCVLSWIYAKEHDIVVSYEGIELYPLDDKLYHMLDYKSCLQKKYASLYDKVVSSNWGIAHEFDNHFIMKKTKADFLSIDVISDYDLIYYDAFAPDKQAELWTLSAFEKAYDMLCPGGVLTTYCAKGVVKRRLKEVGFIVKSLQGPPGKREMIRAEKSA